MTAILTDVQQKHAELAQQAQAELAAKATRRLAYLDAIKTQFSMVSGTDRTELACTLGRSITDSLVEERSIEKKKSWMAELSKQVCGTYADDRKLIGFTILYHVALRVPSLKLLGLSWACKVIGAMGVKLDWKSVTDTMSALQIERSNAILPQLIDGIDGIGRNAKGNPDRAAWCKIVKHYLATGEVPAMADETPGTETEVEGAAGEMVAPVVVPVVTMTPETVAQWLSGANDGDMALFTDHLSQELMERIQDEMVAAMERRANKQAA